jgi:subtilisin family serine protease
MRCGPTKLLLPLLFIFIIDPARILSDPLPKQINTSEQPHRIVLKLKSENPITIKKGRDGATSLGIASVDKVSDQYGIDNQEMLFPKKAQSPYGGALGKLIAVDLKAGTNLEDVVAAYDQLPEVEYAQIDYKLELYDFPDDSLYDRQWSLHNTGQPHYYIEAVPGSNNDRLITITGTVNADIHAQSAFDNPPDNTSTVVVAILDTGVDMAHPELQNRIWTNPGEIADNGIDDDHNGFIDDVHGWDFTGDTSFADPIPDNDPTDNFGHGTHCAGIVAAVANNTHGIAGIVDDCKIMPVKFFPLMLSSYAAQAIVYAADNGADVISMSFGYPWQIKILEDALDYAEARGVILCASAGNDGTEYKNYPAASVHTLAISATNSYDKVTSFSTYGQHIDIAAPGESILSLRAGGTDMYELKGEPGIHIIGDIYYLASGTSMSAPHVAAVAAYMRAVSPGLIPDRAKTILEQSADDLLDPLGRGEYLPGWDKYSGYGRLNLENALALVPEKRTMIESPLPNQIVAGSVPVVGLCDAYDFNGYILEFGSGYRPSAWTEFCRSYSPKIHDTLGYWDTQGLNGIFTIRARMGESNIAYATVFVINSNSISISSPISGDTINSYTNILGDALCPDFDHFTIAWASSQDTDTWTDVYESSRPVENSLLCTFNSNNLIPGAYFIKLAVYSGSNLIGMDIKSIYISQPFSGENAWKISLDTIVSDVPTFGDFDGDGINEIALGTASGIRFFDLDGSQKQIGILEMREYNFRGLLSVGDIDNDGIDDLVALAKHQADGDTVGLLFAFPSSSEPCQVTLPFKVNFFHYDNADVEVYPYVGLKDIDRDGRDEIFVYSLYGSGIYTWKPSQGLKRKQMVTNWPYFSADTDGDGYDEFFCIHGSMLMQTDQSGVIERTFDLDPTHFFGFTSRSISAVDVDGDKNAELVVLGYLNTDQNEHWIYLFDDNLQPMPGWPHNTEINGYLVPTTPVFFDLDQDGEMEYFLSLYELSQGYMLAWEMDGEPINELYQTGIWATAPNPAIITPPLMADLTGEGNPDVLVGAKRDIYHTYKAERMIAWDREGQLLSGWPIVTVSADGPYLNTGIHIPTLGDIDQDGRLEVIATTGANELVYKKIESSYYDTSMTAVLSWKYNRRLNNCFMPFGTDIATSVDDIDDNLSGIIPERFELSQNYPNPFNASTKITFSLPKKTNVSFSIINILGQSVENANLGEMDAGTHSLTWGAEDNSSRSLPSGIYFYQIKTDEWTDAKKMLLLK